MSLHYHYVEDATGDLVDLVPFCSDYCHQTWCREHGVEYGGWNGCQSRPDYWQDCAGCGTLILGSGAVVE